MKGICKTCKNRPKRTCETCGKNRDYYLFRESCEKKHAEFIQYVFDGLKRFKMESTGSATLDMEVLDTHGPWIKELPKDNPFHELYKRMSQSTVAKLQHLFKFGFGRMSYVDFVKMYQEYLNAKALEIRAQIEINKLVFIE